MTVRCKEPASRASNIRERSKSIGKEQPFIFFPEAPWFHHLGFAVDNFPHTVHFPTLSEADPPSVSLTDTTSNTGVPQEEFERSKGNLNCCWYSIIQVDFGRPSLPRSGVLLRLCVYNTHLLLAKVTPRASGSIGQGFGPPLSFLLHPFFNPLSWRLEASVFTEHCHPITSAKKP